MTKDVLVIISGLQIVKQSQDSEPVELIAAGTYYKKNGKHYILYDEVTEGCSGITKNRIKLQDGCVDITKQGVMNAHMIFEKDRNNITCYETPYGSLMFGIHAKEIRILEEEDDISVDVDYVLELNYEYLADCNIKMEIQSKDKKDFRICS